MLGRYDALDFLLPGLSDRGAGPHAPIVHELAADHENDDGPRDIIGVGRHRRVGCYMLNFHRRQHRYSSPPFSGDDDDPEDAQREPLPGCALFHRIAHKVAKVAMPAPAAPSQWYCIGMIWKLERKDSA